jgi:hypothetical protein
VEAIFDGVGAGGTFLASGVIVCVKAFAQGKPVMDELGDESFVIVIFPNGSAVSVPIYKGELVGSPIVAFA